MRTSLSKKHDLCKIVNQFLCPIKLFKFNAGKKCIAYKDELHKIL